MPNESVFNRFARKDPLYIYCILCDAAGKESKYSIKGNMSNFARHVKAQHPRELGEVQLTKQTKATNPFECARKRKPASESDDIVVLDDGPPEKQAKTTQDIAPVPSTSTYYQPKLQELADKVSDYEGG